MNAVTAAASTTALTSPPAPPTSPISRGWGRAIATPYETDTEEDHEAAEADLVRHELADRAPHQRSEVQRHRGEAGREVRDGPSGITRACVVAGGQDDQDGYD